MGNHFAGVDNHSQDVGKSAADVEKNLCESGQIFDKGDKNCVYKNVDNVDNLWKMSLWKHEKTIIEKKIAGKWG